MSEDPWKHRSAGMRCTSCMWFVEKITHIPPLSKREALKKEAQAYVPPFGRCRKHAPTMNGYPAVFGNDWCGDHKLDEEKI